MLSLIWRNNTLKMIENLDEVYTNLEKTFGIMKKKPQFSFNFMVKIALELH